MKQSMRARRMAKQHRRQGAHAKLNLVSLMDIFTIIVFFLLMSSSDVEVLQNQKTITLPESVSVKKPAATLVIMVDAQRLMIGGEVIAEVDEQMRLSTPTIDRLAQILQSRAEVQRNQQPSLDGQSADNKGLSVTIMGDKSVPYLLLKKVMATCAASDYRNISLAVSKIESESFDDKKSLVVEGGV